MLQKLALLVPMVMLLSSCAQTPDPRLQDTNFETGSTNFILYEACYNSDGLSCRKLAEKFDKGIGVVAHKGLTLKYYDRACSFDDDHSCKIYHGVLARGSDLLQKETSSALDHE